MSGTPVRFDYQVIQNVMFDQFGVAAERRREVMSDLMLMEHQAIKSINEK